MTATPFGPVVRRPQVTPYTTDRRIIGTASEVAATVARVRRSGRLIAMTTPRQTNDGRVFVNVRYLTPPAQPARPARPARRRTAVRVAAIATTAAALIGLAVYGVVLLVTALVHLLPLLIGGLVLLLLAWAVLGRAGVCPGVHCPGCTHR
jgi:hypothetical protein